ncbi:DUF6461 domain-containing protein [Streptomyces sp. NPDC059783]|uniref:DUF6461 domain-containing protein n=1 Tax=Streptomyces sp. NPDC059783 TaxID=3346944 RepID=UPI003660201A
MTWAADLMCVTFTRGLDPAEVFARYGADPARARSLDAEEASDLLTAEAEAEAVSLLRSGRLGDWSFCVEEDGVIGSWPEPLAALSRGTETYSVLSTDGLAVFQHWRDGACVENFEPDMPSSRPEGPSEWWDGIQEALATEDGSGMSPVVALVLDRLALRLDDATLDAAWPTLMLSENDAPAASRGRSYASEAPVPPGAIEVL